jgi:hypothetical protein
VPSVVVRGEITASNLSEITPMFDKYLGEIKTELSNDQDFADAEANAKNCRETAKRIQSLRTNIIAQMVDVNAVDGVLANYEDAFNKVGLRLEKAVKEQKETIKTNAVLKTRQAYMDHVQALEAEIAPIRLNLQAPDFAGSFKGVKSIDTMRSRLNDALANGKIEADAMARDIRAKLSWYKTAANNFKFLFNDLSFVIQKPMDDFQMLVNSRIAEHKANELVKEAKIKADAEVALLAKQAAESVEPALKPSEVLTAVLPASMKEEFSNIFTAPIRTQPSANQIVEAVARTFNVDKASAHKWLCDIDFEMLIAA